MRPLIEYLPPHIQADEEMRRIQEALTAVMEREWEANDDLKAQAFPQFATWTLKYWEQRFGLPSDETLSVEARRSALLAKIRSARTATVEAVRSLAQAFTDGVVTVNEYPADYRFDIIIEEQEIVGDWEDTLREALEDFAPAHLGFDIQRIAVGGQAVVHVLTAHVGETIRDYSKTLRY